MKRGSAIFSVIFLFILFSSLVMAQGEEVNTASQEDEAAAAISDLPEPGILPGSMWYGFKTAFQNLRLALLRNEARERYRLRLLDLRLAELKKLEELSSELNASGKNTEKIEARIEKLTERYENQLELSEERIEKLSALGRNVTLLREHVANMTRKHVLVLSIVSEKVPDKARSAILKAINKSIEGNEKAVAYAFKEKGMTEEEVQEILDEARERYRERVSNRTEARVCAQVITQAYDPETEECKVFASPCDVPAGWVKKACRIQELKADVAAIKQDIQAFRERIRVARREAQGIRAGVTSEQQTETQTQTGAESEGATNLRIQESTKISEGVAQQQQQGQ